MLEEIRDREQTMNKENHTAPSEQGLARLLVFLPKKQADGAIKHGLNLYLLALDAIREMGEREIVLAV